MDKQDLAKLALRLYHDDGYGKELLVYRLMSKGEPGSLIGHEELGKDIPTIKNLVEIADCLYIDLFTPEELKTRDFIYGLPEREETERQKRIEPLLTQEERELHVYADYLINCNLDLDTHFPFLPIEFRELIDLAREKSGIVPNDTISGNLADVETVDNDHQSDTEPGVILPVENSLTPSGIEKTKAQQQTNSRPLKRETTSKKPKVLNRQLKPRQRERHITGQNKTLDNGIKLWEADNVTGEPKIYW